MTRYATAKTHPMGVRHAAGSVHVVGARPYPANAAIHSAKGVREPDLINDVLWRWSK